MTNVQIEAGTLTANHEDRIVSGLLLPYGELGNTNIGRFTVDPGVFTIPPDVTVLAANTDHNRENPVARFMTAVETAAGVVASFVVGKNPEGDALLAEIADRNNPERRDKLSVEVADVIIKGGKALGGKIFGAAFVKKGAFPSATLMAADIGGDAPDTNVSPAPLEVVDGKLTVEATATPDEVIVTAENTTTTFAPKPQENPVTLPNTLTATTTEERGISLAKMNTLYAQRASGLISDADFAEAIKGQNGATLFAALSDVKFDGTGGLQPTMSQPQWLGEIKQLQVFRQQVLPLFAHGDLKSLKFNGFKWGTKPAGGDWAGNKGNVPSNTLTVSPVTGDALRYAIGHDIAREFVDFPVDGFFESYAAAVLEDYSRWADAKVAAAITAGATTLAADALTTLPGPTGGTIGSAASAIIDGAAAIVTLGTLPSFALVATALWKQMAKMPRTNVIGYLNVALGLEEGALDGFTIRPSSAIAAGKVLVGAKEAATVYELPGAPIRVDALDLARGGVDKAAFGYLGVNINDATGLQLVTAATS